VDFEKYDGFRSDQFVQFLGKLADAFVSFRVPFDSSPLISLFWSRRSAICFAHQSNGTSLRLSGARGPLFIYAFCSLSARKLFNYAQSQFSGNSPAVFEVKTRFVVSMWSAILTVVMRTGTGILLIRHEARPHDMKWLSEHGWLLFVFSGLAAAQQQDVVQAVTIHGNRRIPAETIRRMARQSGQKVGGGTLSCS